jgi:hypothetical protein
MVGALEAVKYGVIATVAVVGIYGAYQAYKIVGGMVSVAKNIGTGKNAAAAWDARPKIIFKGTIPADINALTGLM